MRLASAAEIVAVARTKSAVVPERPSAQASAGSIAVPGAPVPDAASEWRSTTVSTSQPTAKAMVSSSKAGSAAAQTVSAGQVAQSGTASDPIAVQAAGGSGWRAAGIGVRLPK